MRKVVLCLFYALCAFAIAFSLFWMALPRLALPSPAPGADSAAETPVPSEPSLAAQTLPDTGQPTQYLLRDEGGMVAVYTCGPDGSPTRLARQTDIYVNLLPENDALRVKQGMTVTGDTALQEVEPLRPDCSPQLELDKPSQINYTMNRKSADRNMASSTFPFKSKRLTAEFVRLGAVNLFCFCNNVLLSQSLWACPERHPLRSSR